MEQMVNDESIVKVLLMCNSEYTKKANSKKGGVGVESLIVSPEVYDKTEQTKFIPIVLERDDKGKACVPTFVKSRIYIDFSDDENFENEYDKLLRRIHGKPLHKRPPIGAMPSYLDNETLVYTPTSNLVKKIKNALIEEKSYANNLIQDYFDAFIDALPEFKLNVDELNNDNFIEKVDSRIEEIGVLRNDFETFLTAYLKYSTPDWELLHGLFEKLLDYMENEGASNYSRQSLESISLDATRYFLYELFLSFTAIMIEREYYKELGSMLQAPFLITKHRSRMEEFSFAEFRYWNETLDNFKNKRLQLNRISVTADTMKRRAKSETYFMQMVHADILLHYLSSLLKVDNNQVFDNWFPITACYHSGMKILPKMKSRRHFEKIKELFGVENKEELIEKVDSVLEETKGQNRDAYYRISLHRLDKGLNIGEICTIS